MIGIPTVKAEQNRWYAGVYLIEPTGATGIGGKIYIYDNIISTALYSFSAFRFGLLRYDSVWKTMEWLEVGYFENLTGFYIYSAIFVLNSGYTEIIWSTLAGDGEHGTNYLEFWICKVSGHTYRAYMTDRGMGIWSMQEVTFTIGSRNIFTAESESSDPFNTLDAHYDDLWYSDGEQSGSWEIIHQYCDEPYTLTMGSTNEFYTSGGYSQPRYSRHHRGFGHITMLDGDFI